MPLDEGGGLRLCSSAGSTVRFTVRSARGCSCQHLGVTIMRIVAHARRMSRVLCGMTQSLQCQWVAGVHAGVAKSLHLACSWLSCTAVPVS